jgi:hypothetical protein
MKMHILNIFVMFITMLLLFFALQMLKKQEVLLHSCVPGLQGGHNEKNCI